MLDAANLASAKEKWQRSCAQTVVPRATNASWNLRDAVGDERASRVSQR
jgi:hypothetical protein